MENATPAKTRQRRKKLSVGAKTIHPNDTSADEVKESRQ